MNVGILGLGLIGGSLARAYAKAGHNVFACEQDSNILEFAELSGADFADLNAVFTLPQIPVGVRRLFSPFTRCGFFCGIGYSLRDLYRFHAQSAV